MELEEFCTQFHALLEGTQENAEIYKTGRQYVEELLRDPRWIGGILARVAADRTYLEKQPPSFFSNEIMVYRSSDRLFSINAYIWEPDALCEIHDHSSWGLIGALVNPMREIRYRRLDSRQSEGHAELEEVSTRVIQGGETSLVLPLSKGIHRTGSAGDRYAVSLGVYGKSIRRGYILFFNPSEKKAYRVYSPHTLKQVLAIRALKSAPDVWAAELAAAAQNPSRPEFLDKEFK